MTGLLIQLRDALITLKDLVATLLITGTVAVSAIVNLGAIQTVTAPENNTYKIGVFNYEKEFADDIRTSGALKYNLGDKYIGFKPSEIRVDGVSIKTVQASLREQNFARYKSVFGEGIDIDILGSDRVWSKLLKIDSSLKLGTLPRNAKNVEVVFEVDTNFVIDGWDKTSVFEIAKTTRLGDFSYLEPAKVWDSYKNQICTPNLDTGEDDCITQTNTLKVRSYFSENNGKFFYTKELPVSWLKTALFPIYTDADITYGTASVFTATSTDGISVTEVNTDKFMTSWIDNTAQGIWAIVGTVSGNSITYGPIKSLDVNGDNTDNTSIDNVDTDQAVVCFQGELNDGFCSLIIASATTTITEQSQVEHEDADSIASSFVRSFATDQFVVCYEDGTSPANIECVAATSTAGTLTFGSNFTNQNFDASPCGPTGFANRYATIITLDTNKVLIAGTNATSTGSVCAKACTISGTTPTCGSNIAVSDIGNGFAVFSWVSGDSYATDRAALVWDDGTAASTTVMALVSASGTVSTLVVTSSVSATTETDNNSMVATDASTLIHIFTDQTAGTNYGTSKKIVLSGDTVSTIGTSEVFASVNTDGADASRKNIAEISTDKLVICYQNATTGSRGECIIGDLVVAGTAAPTRKRIIIITED